MKCGGGQWLEFRVCCVCVRDMFAPDASVSSRWMNQFAVWFLLDSILDSQTSCLIDKFNHKTSIVFAAAARK